MSKSSATKKALISSIIALILCFTMLMGATFAWFTDTVSSTGNRILAGDLEIDLVMYKESNGKYVSIAGGAGDIFSEAAGNSIHWEPGKTEIVYLGVRNTGNLALCYSLLLNTKDEGLIGSLEYAIIDGAEHGDVAVTDWDELLERSDVKTGALYEGQLFVTADGVLDEIAYDETATDETDFYAIAIHMKDDASQIYENKSITIDLNVSATQVSAEEDSFGSEYDKDIILPTFVRTQDELAAALLRDGKISLANDLDIDANTSLFVPAGTEAILDLNGHTIEATADKDENQEVFLVKGDLTVSNGTVLMSSDADMGWHKMSTIFDVTAGGVLNIEKAKIENLGGTRMNFCIHLNNWGEVTLDVKDSEITAPYCALRVFNSGPDKNNVTIKDSTINGDDRAIWVHNYTSADFDDNAEETAAAAARLNFDIFNGTNEITNNTEYPPVRYGFTGTIFFDEDGEQVSID